MTHRAGWSIVVWLVAVVCVPAAILAKTGDVPLIDAVKRVDADAVRALLEQSVDVNAAAVDGTTALHWAVHRDDLQLVGALVDAGADATVVNRYHVGLVTYFLEKLKSIEEGDGTLLDKSMIIYGSPMGNPNVHNHKRCPLFVAGGANGQLDGNLHLRAAPGTPMANVMLSLMHKLGLDDRNRCGDSTGAFSLSV